MRPVAVEPATGAHHATSTARVAFIAVNKSQTQTRIQGPVQCVGDLVFDLGFQFFRPKFFVDFGENFVALRTRLPLGARTCYHVRSLSQKGWPGALWSGARPFLCASCAWGIRAVPARSETLEIVVGNLSRNCEEGVLSASLPRTRNSARLCNRSARPRTVKAKKAWSAANRSWAADHLACRHPHSSQPDNPGNNSLPVSFA